MLVGVGDAAQEIGELSKVARVIGLQPPTEPTPHSASGGRSYMTPAHVSWVSANTPAGLANPVATLARSRLSPMPTEHTSPVASSTPRRTSPAQARTSSREPPRSR